VFGNDTRRVSTFHDAELSRGVTIAVMRALFAIGTAAVAAALVLTTASAGPPQAPLHVGVSRQQPIAGERFTGLAITDSAYRITDVRCGDVYIGSKSLTGRFQRFYAPAVGGPSTVTCNWQIPANTSGRTLRVTSVSVDTSGGTQTEGPFTWRIKP
jgi:hypothetical protein